MQIAAVCSIGLSEAMATKQRVTVNLTDREYQKLAALAQKNRVSLAWLGRQSIIEFLDRHANGQQLLPLESRTGEGTEKE